MEPKANRRPLIDPVLLALKSRRVIIALVSLLMGLLMLAIPELSGLRAELLTMLITLALALIGGYTVEDAVGIARQRDPQSEDLRELVKEVLNEFIDSLGEGSSDAQQNL